MRVLFWSGTFWPHIGGVEVLATRLLTVLCERGYEVVVVTSKQSPEQPAEAHYQGIPVYRFAFPGNASSAEQLAAEFMRIKQQISKLKRRFAPDLVHINAGGLGEFFHLVTADAHPAPLLASLHGEWPAGNNGVAQCVLGVANWVVGCSGFILDKGRQLVPEITLRSSVIYNALEPPVTVPQSLPIHAPRLLCLGRLSPEKGFDVAVTAFASLTNRFPHASLVIVGEGPERKKLEGLITKLGLANRVQLTGEIAPDEVPALLNTVTALLVPSRQESFGLVAVEAALMARPVVGTRVGGLPEVILHNRTGLLVESEDSVALADAVADLLIRPNAAAIMGQAARRRAQQVFSWRRHVDAYDALYQKLTQ